MIGLDNIVKVASILSQPYLEQSTIDAINAYIREGIKEPSSPKQQPKLSVDIVNEWLHGEKKGSESS